MIRKILKYVLRKLGYSINRLDTRSEILKELVKVLGFNPTGSAYEFLYDGLSLLNNLKKEGGTFCLVEDKISIEIQGLFFFINTWEELFILNEIIVEGIYDISLKDDFALIDIGMNVGFTSIYFANKNNCKQIFSYEPVQTTLDLAKSNLDRNKCSAKIKLFNNALGYPERQISVYHTAELKGSTGLYGYSPTEHLHLTTDKISLKIEDVSSYLKKNFLDYQGTFVAKIDCEGCEYEIIERLEDTGILTRISIFLIEWHKKGPTLLKRILSQNGYCAITLSEKKEARGMIYAFLKK